MRAVILAAGEGRRLSPLTKNIPKCLVEVGGKPILDWQIELMHRCGIKDIVVVKGCHADKIVRKDVRYRVNKDYNTTNMVMTLWCAKDELKDEVIISYGDIIYNEEALRRLIAAPYDISVVADLDWQKYWQMRFSDPLQDAEAFKMDKEGRISIIGQVARKTSDIDAGYIGLIKFQNRAHDIFKHSFQNAQKAEKPWGTDKVFKKAYMTDMLQGLINEGYDLYAVKIRGGWCEIDTLKDLELAHNLYKEKKWLFGLLEFQVQEKRL